MKLNTLFTVSAIIYFLFGIAFFVLPGTILSFYHDGVTQEAMDMGHILGATYLGIGTMIWLARNSQASEARRAIVMGGFVGGVFGTLAALWVQFSGVVNALGWSTVIINLLFALAYGYFAFMKQEEVAAA